jgi:TAT (twin-arginine translocation) pathway-exported protein
MTPTSPSRRDVLKGGAGVAVASAGVATPGRAHELYGQFEHGVYEALKTA